MTSKTISLKKSAYEKLASIKKEDESFSDVINRLTQEQVPEYSDLAGILSEETIQIIKEIRQARKETDKAEMRKLIKRFGKD